MTGPDATRPVPVCHDDVCITCGDVAVPVRVVELRPGELALVDTGQTLEEIKAPEAGQILFLVVSPAMAKNGLICGIGVEAT